MYSKVTILLNFISVLSFHAIRRAPKNWCFWTVALKKTLESPLDCKEIQPVHPGGDQSWVFIGRTDAEAEAPILWPPDVKNWLIRKDPDAGKDWRQEEKGMTEDEMVRWHHQLDGHEFEQAPGVGDGQGSPACCDSWDHRVGHDWATELNWTKEYSTAVRMSEPKLGASCWPNLKIILLNDRSKFQKSACSTIHSCEI